MAFYPCLQAVNSGEVIIKKMQQEFVTSSSQLMCVTDASSDFGADWPAWKAFTNGKILQKSNMQILTEIDFTQ